MEPGDSSLLYDVSRISARRSLSFTSLNQTKMVGTQPNHVQG